VGGEDERALDALPVLADAVRLTPVSSSTGALPAGRRPVIPTVQAAAVAAGGFVAGAAVVGLVHRRQRRSAMLAGRRRGAGRRVSASQSRAVELVQIVGSRSLLVDVHLLGNHGDH
jgi:hypothetical protein